MKFVIVLSFLAPTVILSSPADVIVNIEKRKMGVHFLAVLIVMKSSQRQRGEFLTATSDFVTICFF